MVAFLASDDFRPRPAGRWRLRGFLNGSNLEYARMSGQFTLVAFIMAKPGQEEELGRCLDALVAPMRSEAGCIDYDLHRSNEIPQFGCLMKTGGWKTTSRSTSKRNLSRTLTVKRW